MKVMCLKCGGTPVLTKVSYNKETNKSKCAYVCGCGAKSKKLVSHFNKFVKFFGNIECT